MGKLGPLVGIGATALWISFLVIEFPLPLYAQPEAEGLFYVAIFVLYPILLSLGILLTDFDRSNSRILTASTLLIAVLGIWASLFNLFGGDLNIGGGLFYWIMAFLYGAHGAVVSFFLLLAATGNYIREVEA